MKQLYSVLLVLSLVNLSLMAGGQQENRPENRTSIKSSQVTEVELTGILEKTENSLYLVIESGERYAINIRPENMEGGPTQGGPPPGEKGMGGPGGKNKDSQQRPAPPEMGDQFAEYIGEDAVVIGKMMDAPPENRDTEEITGVLFPQSILIDGKEIL